MPSHVTPQPQWVLSPLVAAVLMALPALAHAQATPTTSAAAPAAEPEAVAPTASKLGSVVVTGQRAAFRRAIANKENATRIMDSVAADDVQQLPDSTVAETLRRIPGASVTFNNDNVHGRDEAERPVLRGLDARYNNTTIDGLSVASADSNTARGARLDLLPASMIDRLEVYKSWTPDQDPNAIGGSTNVATRSAFARGGRLAASISAAVGSVSNHGKPFKDDGTPFKGDFSLSTTFGEEKNYGVSISGYREQVDTYTVGHATTDSTYYDWYTNAGVRKTNPADSNGYAVPQNTKYFWFQDSREREGVTLKLEAKPISGMHLFMTGGRFQNTLKETRNENYISVAGNINGMPAPTNQTATSGDFARAEAEIGYARYDPFKRTTDVLQLGGDWKIDEANKVSLKHSWSQAKSDKPILMSKYIQGLRNNTGGAAVSTTATPNMALSYDTAAFEQVFTLNNPGNWTDPSLWRNFYHRQQHDETTNRLNDTRFDFSHRLEADDRGWGFGAGFNYRVNKYAFNVDQYELRATSNDMGGTGIVSATDALLPSGGGLPLLVIDPAAAAAQVAGNPSKFTPVNVASSSNQDDFQYKEKLSAGYVMVGYNTDKLRSLLGLRYDSAKVNASAMQKVTANGTTDWTGISSAASYDNVLPSFSATYALQPNLKLRGAFAQTIGRADFDAYAPRSSTTLNSDGSVTVTLGNPDIKPRKSTNLDLSLEKYLGNGLVSLAVFNKDIKDEIYTARASGQTVSFDGVDRIATISKPENASGAKVTGIELGGVLSSLKEVHNSLRHFGVSANLTFMDGQLNVTKTDGTERSVNRMLGQPDTITNLALFYATPKADMRLAFNRVGSSLRAVDVAAPWNDVYWAPRKQVDLSARYRLDKQWTLFGEVKNLTEEKVTSVTGPNKNLNKDTYLVGRTIWVGVKWQH